jgi:molybdopterin-guanine dinucleotide biosynthesis protein B
LAVVVAVVGGKKSGKTWTMEYLISKLAGMGFKIGAVKHIHEEGITIDTTGKDTWKFAKAGAKVILSSSPDELALIKRSRVHYRDLDTILGYLKNEELDFIFIEGFHSLVAKRPDVYKILAARDAEDLNRLLVGTEPPIVAATGVIGERINELADPKLPIINLSLKGEDLVNMIKSLAEKRG